VVIPSSNQLQANLGCDHAPCSGRASLPGPTRNTRSQSLAWPGGTQGFRCPRQIFSGGFLSFLKGGTCETSEMVHVLGAECYCLSLSFCFVIFVHLDVGAAPISCVYFFSNILCHFQRRLMVWAFAISLQWTPPHVQTFLTKSTSDLCRVAGYFSGDNFHQRDSSNHMEVSWNRGTRKSSIFVWDFTL
jgi:hypothetical protein